MNTAAQHLSKQEEFVNLVLRLRSKGLNDIELFSALEQTPRRRFVDSQWADVAYQNTVIPIECGEYIERIDEQCAILSMLDLERKHRVLEVGTGSGFTAAVMAHIAGRITTVERYKTLYDNSRARFQALKLDNIACRQMDGLRLPPGLGPFDRIVIWPSLPTDPQYFLELLAGNGILIAPIGQEEEKQVLVKYGKIGTRFERSDMFRVRYQPFIEGIAAYL